MKRWLSCLLAAAMLFGVMTGLPISAQRADEIEIPLSEEGVFYLLPEGEGELDLPEIKAEESLSPAPAANGVAVDPTKYTYEVIPLLAPFNEYFYVKTDNPDPKSFRFADHDSVYSDEATIELYRYAYSGDDLFADVVYENPETKRVKGGYIFESYTTDGGRIALQMVAGYDYWGYPTGWKDAGVTLTLPSLCDDIDYLIKNFSSGSGFFDKMDAIQTGLSSICLYSGSYIRGQLSRTQSYWSMSRSPYIDQLFYLYSPFTRTDNRYLFASALYPFQRDSLGFPSTMATVAMRLDESATYQWSSFSHAYVDITYNGETRTYGGQGNGEGQALSEDKITKTFAFGGQDMGITMEGLKQLQNEYAAAVVEDDIPREDELTCKAVADTVGKNGAWVRFANGFTYLYKSNENDYYYEDEFGAAGHKLYWGGSLSWFTNAWVDGRHMGRFSMYEPGATFADFPNDAVVLTDAVYPSITYDRRSVYDRDTGKYQYEYYNVSVTEKVGLLRFNYNEETNTWDAYKQTYNEDANAWEYSDYSTAALLAEKGLLDEKYLDMLRLTYDQVLALGVDRNTDLHPEQGYNYTGTAAPGTPFDRRAIRTEDPAVLFAEAKKIAEENRLAFRLDEGYYGMCGDDMYWVYLAESKTLIITGTGDMATLGTVPWYYISAIQQVFVGEGVESIQDQAFYACTELKAVSLPSTLKRIGWEAFRLCTSLTNIEIPEGVETVGGGVFDRCYDLTDIYCLRNGPGSGWEKNWLGDCNATVHWRQAKPKTPLGDVNGDGVVNASDGVILRRYLAGWSVVINGKVSDINDDGFVNASDSTLLARYLAGWKVSYPIGQ